MKTKIIECTNGEKNWGKFLLGQFDQASEWVRRSVVSGELLLVGRGHRPSDTLVLDLQTCEGAIFSPGGLAKADLDKHRIWVCPLFEPFLEWLYTRVDNGVLVLDTLPDHIDLPNAQFAMSGHRRQGRVACPTCQGHGKLCVDDYLGIVVQCHRCNGTKTVPSCAECERPL